MKNNGEQPQYYLTGTYEAIVTPDQWECVQLELARRKRYAEKHHVALSSNQIGNHPFSGKVICNECGYSFLLKFTNRLEDNGKPRCRCGSFYKFRGKVDRSIYACHRLWIKQDEVEQAFIRAWNMLTPVVVSHDDNVLTRFRKRQLNQLLEEHGRITEAPAELVLKVLDHIEVTVYGGFTVNFLANAIAKNAIQWISPLKSPRWTKARFPNTTG